MNRAALERLIKTFQIGDETFIRIKTSENSDPPLRYGEVTGYVKGLNIRNVDFNAVKLAYKSCRGQSVRVGGSAEKAPEPADTLYSVDVSDDAMFCYLTLFDGSAGNRLPELPDILDTLKKRGIVSGLREESIREALEKKKFRKRVAVAKGVYPEAGRDASVKLVPGLYGNIGGFRSECASVEKFRKSTFIRAVSESDHIAWKIKETPGVKGLTIFDEELKTLPGIPVESADANIFMSEEKVFTNIDGHVIKTWSGVRVEPLLTVKHAANKKIVHDGSVKILGDVESCPVIEASGDIEIHGTVNNTKMDAGRNIVIHGNLFTRQDKIISAGNTFIGQNVSNAAITAENIIITATSFNSILTAFRTIHNTVPGGKIVGGRACAGAAFFTATLGSSTNIPTMISVAAVDFFNKFRKEILEYYTKKIYELNNQMAFLEKKSEHLEVLKRGVIKDRRSVYNLLKGELTSKMEKNEFKINRLQDKITRLKNKNVFAARGEILADKIFPNTSIELGEKKMVINEPLSNIRVQMKKGEIVIRTFHRNSARW